MTSNLGVDGSIFSSLAVCIYPRRVIHTRTSVYETVAVGSGLGRCCCLAGKVAMGLAESTIMAV